MKIKTLIKELNKLDKNLEIKLYPKYVDEDDTFKRHKFLKRYFCPCERDGEEWIEIRF